jgi:uncharacterized protein (UPF0210 family)
MRRRDFLRGTALVPGVVAGFGASAGVKPKVRAITAFVALDRARYQAQIQDTLKMLGSARRVVEHAGYQVEGVRITTQPFAEYTRGLSRDDSRRFFREYIELATKEGFAANIGPARVGDIELLGEILSEGRAPNASLIIADENGIHWDGVRAAAKVIQFVAEHSPGSAGNFNFAATAMLEPYAPFFPGSNHVGSGRRFSIGTEGANVVDQVFAETAGNTPLAIERLTSVIGEHATALEKAAKLIEKETGWAYMGIDATPAPLGDVSIGAAIEKFTGAKFGSAGTMTAAAVITRAVQAAPVKRVGYSGLMVPVMEDKLLAQRWSEGTYGVDAVLAYSAVCGTGLDTIPLAGDVSQQQIERILGDVASLAFKWKKPLSARLLPCKGKKAGERTSFEDPFLINTLIRAVP